MPSFPHPPPYPVFINTQCCDGNCGIKFKFGGAKSMLGAHGSFNASLDLVVTLNPATRASPSNWHRWCNTCRTVENIITTVCSLAAKSTATVLAYRRRLHLEFNDRDRHEIPLPYPPHSIYFVDLYIIISVDLYVCMCIL